MIWPGLSKSDEGNAAVEFAFILPAVLGFLLGLYQGALLLWTQTALHYSVQTAAHCASINTTTCGTTSQIQSYAASASGATFDTSVFTVTTPSCGKQVAASYAMSLLYPFTSSSVTLTAQSCYPAAH